MYEEHFDKQTFDDEEVRKESRKETDLEIKKENRCIHWYEKQIASLERNPTQIMKKVLSKYKKEDFYIIVDELIKELPDSYY